jgi:hypothetical protein
VEERPETAAAGRLICPAGAFEGEPLPELPAGAALPPAEAVAAPVPLAALPVDYGTGRLRLIAREPRCLYAQWDLSDEQLQACEARAATGRLALNVRPKELHAGPHQAIELPSGTRACFVAVGRGGATWVAELGYWDTAGQWQSVATSEPATAPPEAVVTEPVPQFATLAAEALLPAQGPEVTPSAGQPAATAAAVAPPELDPSVGLPAVPEPVAPVVPAAPAASEAPSAAPPQPRPPPEPAEALAQLAAFVLEQLATGASSVALAQQQPPAAPGLPAGTPVGVSSPAGAPGSPGTPAAQRGFWFNLGVELVIYGATEPDAKVTVGGRRIELRPDGTFSLRVALPDGQYELPLVAISATDDDGRSAMLRFSRHTDYWGAANAPGCKPERSNP